MADSYISCNNHHLLTSLLFLTTIASFLSPSLASVKSTTSPRTTNTEFIRSSCGVTTYPSLCFSSLLTQANVIQTSPKLITHAALNVSLSTAKSMSAMMARLSRSSGLRPREAAAIRDCVEELGDTVEELRRSIGEMGRLRSSNYEVYINDIQTWVSAALTDENTCTDGFGGKEMNGKMKSFVRERIVVIAQLTSNALALVNHFASLHG